MRAVLLLLALFGFLAPASAQQGHERGQYFEAWLAQCGTDDFCSAQSFVNPDPGTGAIADYVFRIGRHAEQSYWEIAFTPVLVSADEWSDFVLTVDGTPFTFSLRSEVGAYGKQNDFYLLGDKAQALMDALVPGSSLNVTFSDSAGVAQQANFSLDGLAAALLWIDEQQKRVGSERVASAPPYGLAPTGGEQTEIPTIPVELLERQRADPDCRPFEELANGRDIAVHPLGESGMIYILPCDAGAYNFVSKIYSFDGVTYTEHSFAEYSETFGWTATSSLIGAWYDPDTQTLTSYAKGRGLGDCGTSGTWKWNEYTFQLIEFSNKEECDDPENPGNFPIVYSASSPASAAGTGSSGKELPPLEKLMALVAADPECLSPPASTDEITSAALDKEHRFYLVPCEAGAYNFASKAYVESLPSGDMQQVALPHFAATSGWTASALLFNGSFDESSATLSSFYKSRGLGDCGTSALWRWTETPGFAGHAFALVEFRAKEECDGKAGDFPIVYEAAAAGSAP